MNDTPSARILAVHPVLAARDVGLSVAFYRRLGFAVAFQDAEKLPRYAVVERNGVALHLQWADAVQWEYPGDRPAYRFRVSGVDALHAQFMEAGIAVEAASGSPWATPGGTPWGTREFHLRDPGDNVLQFYQPR
ncbi:MAG: VOC family protein [Lysobacteraceae bacterium]